MPKAKKVAEPREAKEIAEFETMSLADFERLPERELPSGAKNIVTTLLGKLEEKEAKVFRLDWREYSGLRRHITLKGAKAVLKAKLQSWEGSGKDRYYKVAVARA